MTAFSGNWFQRRSARRAAAAEAYRRLLHQALDPVHYLEHGVPDTFEGRAGMVTLLTSLTCARLGQIGGTDAARLIQRLNDLVLDGFDAAYREKGVGDASISRKVRGLAQGHAGLGKALFVVLARGNSKEASPDEVAVILVRNAVVSPDRALALAEALLIRGEQLARQPDAEILQGRLDWAPARAAVAASPV